MPKYLLAATLTQGGVQGVLKEGGTGRRAAVQKTAESVGGTVEAFYFAFGENDVYVIIDVPNPAAAAAVSMRIRVSTPESTRVEQTSSPDTLGRSRSRTTTS